ncbi:hypothetical protein RDABS01_033180 [Bienertia sinuspersici]
MACSHAGLVEEGPECVNHMHSLYGITPGLEHYTCVVDMLARAGRLYGAFQLVEDMPMEADAKIWSSLVSSCKTHGNLVLRRIAAEKLLQLDSNRVENYVLVSNLLAQSGRKAFRKMLAVVGLSWWEDLLILLLVITCFLNQKVLEESGSNKRFHHFKNGCCSCGDYWFTKGFDLEFKYSTMRTSAIVDAYSTGEC